MAFTQLMPITHILTIPITSSSFSVCFFFFFFSFFSAVFLVSGASAAQSCVWLMKMLVSTFLFSGFQVFFALSPFMPIWYPKTWSFVFSSRFRICVSCFCFVGVVNWDTLLDFTGFWWFFNLTLYLFQFSFSSLLYYMHWSFNNLSNLLKSDAVWLTWLVSVCSSIATLQLWSCYVLCSVF